MSIEAMSWAEAHFSGADLGDARPTKRLVAVMARMAEAPDESIPTRMGTVAGAKAAYRLFATGAVTHVFATGAVTHASVMAPHRRLCLAEAAHHPVVLMVHDDTLLDLSGHPSLPETGRLGNGHGTGFIAHSGLAGLPNREVLGLVHQAIWARPPKDTPDVPSESRVWSDTVTSVGSAPEGGTFLSVGDRGADVFDHLVTARAAGWEVVVRAYHDRRMADGQRSLTALRQAKAQGAATVQTKRPRTERSPSASPGVLWRSSHRVVAPTPPFRVTGIRVWGNGVEWILLTTCPVADVDDALRITGWYAVRWTVFALDSVCAGQWKSFIRPGRRVAAPNSAGWRARIG